MADSTAEAIERMQEQLDNQSRLMAILVDKVDALATQLSAMPAPGMAMTKGIGVSEEEDDDAQPKEALPKRRSSRKSDPPAALEPPVDAVVAKRQARRETLMKCMAGC